MKAYKASLINSLTLIIFGMWGYMETSSTTALIPVVFGVILLFCSFGIKKENKMVAHIAVLLTLVILIALIGMRLPKSIDSGGIGLFRVIIMILSSGFAMVYFIQSFISARKR